MKTYRNFHFWALSALLAAPPSGFAANKLPGADWGSGADKWHAGGLWASPPPMTVPWDLTWEDGAKAMVTPEADGRFELRSLIPKGKKYERATARIDFEVPEAGIAILGLGADWYLEVKLNGAVIFDTMASGNSFHPPSARNHVLPVALRAGRNELVVHSRTGDASWIVYAKFFAPTPENLRMVSRHALLDLLIPGSGALDYAPWVTPLENGRYRISFITSGRVGAGVDWREVGTAAWSRAYELRGGRIRTDSRIHHRVLDTLRPGRHYEYRAVTVDPRSGVETCDPTIRRLELPPEQPEKVCFFAYADLHRTVETRVELLRDYRRNCRLAECDFIVSLGDVADKFDRFEFSYFAGGVDFLQNSAVRSQPFVAVRGNHEFRGREADDFFRYFATPEGRSYRGFRYGMLAVVVLDAGECDPYKPNPGSHTFLNRETEFMAAQRQWLEHYLDTPEFQTARYRIVLAHGGPQRIGTNHYMPDNLRRLTDGLLTGENPRQRLDLWLAGHVHQYRQDAAGTDPAVPFPVLFAAGPGHGRRAESAFLVTATAEALQVAAVDRTGTIFDQLSVPGAGR